MQIKFEPGPFDCAHDSVLSEPGLGAEEVAAGDYALCDLLHIKSGAALNLLQVPELAGKAMERFGLLV
jgi:hypothetical protein